MKSKYLMIGAAVCAALFLFSGIMLCRQYADGKQATEAFEQVAALVETEPAPTDTPQETEQYGQVFRVSVARVSLKVLTSASAAFGEKPIMAMVDPPSPAVVILKNCRRVTFIQSSPYRLRP